ncbi:MAG: radical SAM protein, partial [Lentisphaerae bacterium]
GFPDDYRCQQGIFHRSIETWRPSPPLDVAKLPFPVDPPGNQQLNSLNVASSRGCRNACSFCFIPPYYNFSGVRWRAPEHVIAEIDHRLRDKPHIHHIYFVDPSFPGYSGELRQRSLAILRELACRGLRFGFEARVDDLTPEFLARAVDYGLESIFLGVESASERILKLIRKRITPQQASEAIRMIQRHAIQLHLGFIMYHPLSTIDDLACNFDFLVTHEILRHPDVTANMLHHAQIVLRGTPAWASLARQGLLEPIQGNPFEARIRFQDPVVQAIARTTNQVVLYYFQLCDELHARYGLSALELYQLPQPPHLPAPQRINRLLIECFAQALQLGRTCPSRSVTSALEDLAQQTCRQLEQIMRNFPLSPAESRT